METSRNLRLVSFDGGGVRSFSQLIIMRAIMHQLNYNTNEAPKLPWERFDFMGGSGTGGLIAIMFARLHMSVEEVLDEFDIIVEQVYNQEDISPSERTARLRSCMEDLMKRRNHPLDAKLIDEKSVETCACFVLSRLRVNTGPKICLRSYPVQSFPITPITIIDAVLATCAIQPQFDPVVCGQGYRKKEYVGAGIGANNPIREVIAEAQLVFGGDTNVASLLSLGNGHPGIITISSGGGELGLSKVIWDVMNDCTQTAREVEQQIGTAGVYFRFSVEQGMQADHSKEIADSSWIVAQTESYIEDPATHNRIGTFARGIDASIQPITITQLSTLRRSTESI
ncbi:hypothetical protein M408DRAFT_135363 [Serendipita vermifera MAFF 305830]|uniref:PNPLA domain-containing protein n=1 Tax=Serendipita vermifera MAFF 305830 TaxID=933852 RepID=A0A0C2W1U9_SERVB|nr:hypothetical protein M408DRAFT_135363 [Serendipita vermifera MAFF 305830]